MKTFIYQLRNFDGTANPQRFSADGEDIAEALVNLRQRNLDVVRISEKIQVPKEKTLALYTFRFASGGGFNSVSAFTMDEAQAAAAKAFPGHPAAPESFKRLGSEKAREAYYSALSLMD